MAREELARPDTAPAARQALEALDAPHTVRYWRAVAYEVKRRLPAAMLPPVSEERRARMRATSKARRERMEAEAREAAREAMPRYLAALPGPMSGADAWRYWRDSWSWSDPAGDALAWLRRKDWLRMLRESGHATGEGRRLRVDPCPEAAGGPETA